MRKTLLVFALALTTVSAGSVFAAPATHREPLDAATLNTVKVTVQHADGARQSARSQSPG
jgi:hypothetical protein